MKSDNGSALKVYNTKTRQKEEFKPLLEGKVSLYCCGPTVYNYAHLGNMRTYIFEDVLVRTLEFLNYNVKHVMNITDVGHLTDDGDDGEDKLEVGARREGKTVWEVAKHYTDSFFAHAKLLGIRDPSVVCKATDYIKEQIDLISQLEKKGYTYVAGGNVYFDTSKFADYAKFANLQLDADQKHRVDTHVDKKHPADFVLWFTNSKFKNHAMQWDSPWGKGYPGWHIECSAMAKATLGETIDIHCGGIDHVSVHHTNEIAQSECAHDKPFANYWMHGEFLIDADGGRMAKSKGNFLTVDVLVEKGYDPLVYRYLTFQTHYRKQLHFSWDAMDSAAVSLKKIHRKVLEMCDDDKDLNSNRLESFTGAICDDLNMPKALAVFHEALDAGERATVLEMDNVFGLGLAKLKVDAVEISDEVQTLLDERLAARKSKDWAKSDKLRDKIGDLGFVVKDFADGQTVEKK